MDSKKQNAFTKIQIQKHWALSKEDKRFLLAFSNLLTIINYDWETHQEVSAQTAASICALSLSADGLTGSQICF